MKFLRREFLQLAAGAAALPAFARAAWALDYPTRPVHIVAGYPAGAGPRHHRPHRRRTICRSGSASNSLSTTGRGPPAISAPNTPPIRRRTAYTLLIAVSTNAINSTLYSNTTNFQLSSTTNAPMPIARVGITPFVVVANPSFPGKNKFPS